MTDRVVIMRARLDEATRRMVAAGVPEVLRFHQQNAYLKQVLADEEEGRWSPLPTEDVPAASLPGPAPVASAPVPAPAVAPEARARSMWSKAVTEANAGAFALGDPAPAPVDPQAEDTGQTMPPAGSVARSRSAWGRAVADANAELVRRGGKVSEG